MTLMHLQLASSTRTTAVRHPPRRRTLRRGSAMVIILGVLSLLAMVGLALIAKTHGEARRVTIQAGASSEKAAMESGISRVQEVLRTDVWGDPPLVGAEAFERPLSNDAPPGTDPNPAVGQVGNKLSLRENNEPFDAPGLADMWLGSNMPYAVDPFFLPALTEADVLAWDHVSYLGSDILQPQTVTRIDTTTGLPVTRHVNPFMWESNVRTGDPALVRYDATSLNDVEIIQRPPPPMIGEPLIPGSTTTRTIRRGREVWSDASAGGHFALLAQKLALPLYAAVFTDLIPKYPYFDTNADGEIDLYDADGDGVPDSPLSMVLELDRDESNEPRRLYAAIRVVDHGGMLNLNTASSLRLMDGSLNFDELQSAVPLNKGFALQRRGNRTTEFVLEDVVHRDDWLTTNRVANLVDYRSNSGDPEVFDIDFVRRQLVGGLPDFSKFYLPYDLGDEASLRHRNMMVRYDRAKDRAAPVNDYRNIDRALRGSLLWDRVITNGDPGTYAGAPRWSRLNSNFGDTANYEGYLNANGAGWRDLLDEDELFAVRKPMLTTVNGEVAPPPSIGLEVFPPVPGESPIDRRLLGLWAAGMDWPVLLQEGSLIEQDATRPDSGTIATLIDEYVIPAADALPADWARVQPIDLNMSSAANPASAKDDFIRYSAAAMKLALDAGSSSGGFNYQGMPLQDTQTPGASLNRQYLAWQFAVNMADFRDSDATPTYWAWQPTVAEPARHIFGVDKQPFFTEAYAFLTAGNDPSSGGPSGQNPPPGQTLVQDEWYFAFELFIPPGWEIPTANLYFRAPELGPDLTPLTSFRQQVGAGLGSPLGPTMVGGPADIDAVADLDHGNYYVFCSELDDAPADVRTKLQTFSRTYVQNGFLIDTSGRGRLELVYSPTGLPTPAVGDLPNHVLDVIGPQYSGGELADDTFAGTGGVFPGTTDNFSWANRPSLTVMPEGANRAFSLRRSTKGWRFTTAWHLYSFAPSGVMVANAAPFDETLGSPNAQLDLAGSDINSRIPESIWPALTSMASLPAGDDFVTGLPFMSFDSVGDLSRMLMVGPVNLTQAPPRPILFDYNAPAGTLRTNGDFPATVLIADALVAPPSGNAPFGDSSSRVAAGRVDFVDAYRVGTPSQPWTWRLFDYFTTRSALHDNIDNDGDGLIDLENDPTEAVDVSFRVAGRVNVNTAPATVMRSGPFMSFLPTSPTLAYYNPTPIADPVASFTGNPGTYWDLPTAIIATRENRTVPLRLPQAGTGIPQTVASAKKSSPGGGTGPGGSSGPGGGSATTRDPFESLASLALLNDVTDVTAGRDQLFDTHRFHAYPALGIGLYNHIIPDRDPTQGGTNTHPQLGYEGTPHSPDFRYRPVQNNADFVPIEDPNWVPGSPSQVRSEPGDGGGVRGRDIFLSRLTNVYSTRSDVFTAYIALIDEDGHYVHRCQVTLDRTPCFREVPAGNGPRRPVLPQILTRTDGSYTDDMK